MRIFNEVGRWYSIPCKILTQVIYVKKKKLNPLKRIRVIIRTPTHGRTDGRTDRQTDGRTNRVNPVYPPQLRCGGYNKPLRLKLHEPVLTKIHVAIWRYWQDELISVILQMHNHSLLTHWGRDKMATILQTTCAVIQRYFSTELIRAGAAGCSFHIEQRQNDRHLADDIFKFTSMYDFCFILIKILLEFVSQRSI